MFRLTRYLDRLASPDEAMTRPQVAAPTGPVVIWNLIRRCNLTCKHCYATSADRDFAGELDHGEARRVMDDLKSFGVPVLILSGGEPLMRPDIFELSARAKAMGFYVGLSSNGTLISEDNIDAIAAVGYDYVGISLDGLREVHDRFRRKQGAFDAALHGIRLCRDAGIKVGLRFTLTRDNADDLPGLLALMEREGIDKFYLSHLNYAGRGNRNRAADVQHRMTRAAMELLFETCWQQVVAGTPKEFVTGNNDADGPYLLQWVKQHLPDKAPVLEAMLRRWGGNASGVNISQHRQPRQRASRHHVVGLHSGQRARAALLRHLGGYLRPPDGGPETATSTAARPLRGLPLPGAVWRQQSHTGLAADRQPLGRGSGLLPERRRDRCH